MKKAFCNRRPAAKRGSPNTEPLLCLLTEYRNSFRCFDDQSIPAGVWDVNLLKRIFKFWVDYVTNINVSERVNIKMFRIDNKNKKTKRNDVERVMRRHARREIWHNINNVGQNSWKKETRQMRRTKAILWFFGENAVPWNHVIRISR